MDNREQIAERLQELRHSEAAREDFIQVVRATRAFDEDERKAYFIRQSAKRQQGEPFRGGEFSDRKMERAFIGYCLGRAVAEVSEYDPARDCCCGEHAMSWKQCPLHAPTYVRKAEGVAPARELAQ